MKIFRLATAPIKIHQILMLFLEPRGSFSSNFVSLFRVMRQLFCTFSSKTLYALNKTSASKCEFSDFRLLAWKLTMFLMSFFKPQVSFPSDFPSLFSIMTHKSYEIFKLKHMLWTKRAYQNTIFQTFECSDESSPNSSWHFWNHEVKVYSHFA